MTAILQRWLARILIAAGVAALVWVAVNRFQAASYQQAVETTLAALRASSVPVDEPAGPVSLAEGEPIGSLEIVRVGLSGAVVEGDGDAVLDRAIGHLPDTPLPWHTGNSALAAHRA